MKDILAFIAGPLFRAGAIDCFFPLTLLVLLGADTTWAQSSPDILWQIRGHTGAVESVAFSPDGVMVASGSSGSDPNAQIRSVSNGDLLHVFPGQANGVRSVDMSPTGLLAVGGIVPSQTYPVNAGGTDVWRLSD